MNPIDAGDEVVVGTGAVDLRPPDDRLAPVPKIASREDRLEALKEKLPKGKRPVIFISVAERHVGQPVIDP